MNSKNWMLLIISIIFQCYLFYKYPSNITDNYDFISWVNEFKKLLYNQKADTYVFYWLSPLFPFILFLFSFVSKNMILNEFIISIICFITTFFILLKYLKIESPIIAKYFPIFYLFSPMLIQKFHLSISGSLYILLFSLLILFSKIKIHSIYIALTQILIYLTRPEGIFLFPYTYFLLIKKKQKLILPTIIIILSLLIYLYFLYSFEKKILFSVKKIAFYYLFSTIYIESQKESENYDILSLKIEKSIMFKIKGSIASNFAKGTKKISNLKYSPFFLIKVYLFLLKKMIRFFIYHYPLLNLILLITGMKILLPKIKKNILWYILICLPVITYPFGTQWSLINSTNFRHLANLEPIFLPFTITGFIFIKNKFNIKYLSFFYIIIMLFFFYNHRGYLKTIIENSYIESIIFLKNIKDINMKNKNVMCIDHVIPYYKNANWIYTIKYDKNFKNNLKKLNVDFYIKDKKYNIFLEFGINLMKNPPPYFKLIYSRNINNYKYEFYKIDKSQL